LAEVKKLRQMSPMSAEATVVRNYLDWLLSHSLGQQDQGQEGRQACRAGGARRGPLRPRQGQGPHPRISRRAAARRTSCADPILCLVGPPGVGKTSLGKSIAKRDGPRRSSRMSLGGVRDEAEIRGHRRTYIGSMPGKVIQSMKKAKTPIRSSCSTKSTSSASDYRGDPSAALLEVLDPEQNSTFNDHYLEVDYDLSDVMFITTANSLNMPQPLLDRMEIIRIPGYTEEEKLEIAKRHLLRSRYENHGSEEGKSSACRTMRCAT
jgi:ATP-dependent Lon protease